MNTSTHQRLADLALSLNLTPAQAVMAPTVLDKFAEVARTPAATMAADLLWPSNRELREYFGKVCRDAAASTVGRQVAREGGFA